MRDKVKLKDIDEGISNLVNKTLIQLQSTPVYHYLKFKVAGVTFNNGRKSRQSILRAIRWGDVDVDSIGCKEHIYNGELAIYVKINGEIVGNMPKELVATYAEYNKKYKADWATCNVYGGNKLNDGTRTSYGCEVELRFLEVKELTP